MSESTSIKLKDGTRERLRQLADSKQRSTNWLMNDAIGRYLDREEARLRLLDEMRQAHEDYVAGGRLHLTHEEVVEWFERLKTDRNAPMPKLHP